MPSVSRDKVLFSSNVGAMDGQPAPPDIEFEEPDPSLQTATFALGVYLKTWDQVESALFDLFVKLLGAHQTAAYIIVSSGVGQQTIRDIVLALSGQRLKSTDQKILASLMERTKKATTKRNKLVHGRFHLAISIHDDRPNTASWERFYPPVDPRKYGQMRNQKTRDDHVFTVKRIESIVDETQALAREIKAFADKVVVVPYPDARPLA